EYEVLPVSSSFTGVPTHYSETLTKGTCSQQQFPWTRITGLTEGISYKWRVREVAYYDGASSWVAFNGGATAFTTGPAPANHLAFLTGAGTPTAGACAGPATVQLQNAGGSAVNVGSASSVPVFQTSNVLPYVSYFSNSSCDAGITAATMAAGT